MLAYIAVPLLIPATVHWWEEHSSQTTVAVGLGVPVTAWVWPALGRASIFAAVAEYVQFICLLLTLFVASGGVFLKGDTRITSRNNMIFLAIGGAPASFVGTTGAATLLIRPLLITSKKHHYRVHTMLYVVFIVANCDGLLTPLGDPPLLLSFLRGVPFIQTLNLLCEYLSVSVMLLVNYHALGSYYYSQEPAKAVHDDGTEIEPLGLRDSLNFVLFAAIIAAVAFAPSIDAHAIKEGYAVLGDWIPAREPIMLAPAAGSYFLGSRKVRFKDNQFAQGLIAEVGILFIGIFPTVIPVLHYLNEVTGSLPLNEVTFFIFTDGLSSVLDNAPTYVTFFKMADKTSHPGGVDAAGIPELHLVPISLSAVLCDAITYIGNDPNFMVKSVTESDDVEMPNFGGYVGRSIEYLVPIIAAIILLFIAPNLLWKTLGGVLTVGLLVLDARLLSQPRRLALIDQAEGADDQADCRILSVHQLHLPSQGRALSRVAYAQSEHVQLGHVIYKVKDLSRAVVDFETRGLTVEHGMVKRPYNALTCFSSGPRLELLAHTGIPPLLGRLLALGPRRGAARYFLSWNRGPEGVRDLCLEGGVSELEGGRTLLSGKSLRLRPKCVGLRGRELCYEVSLPGDVGPPFPTSHSSADPRPRDFAHPNGIGSIAHVTYPMSERKWNTVLRLSDNDRPELVEPWQPATMTLGDGNVL